MNLAHLLHELVEPLEVYLALVGGVLVVIDDGQHAPGGQDTPGFLVEFGDVEPVDGRAGGHQVHGVGLDVLDVGGVSYPVLGEKGIVIIRLKMATVLFLIAYRIYHYAIYHSGSLLKRTFRRSSLYKTGSLLKWNFRLRIAITQWYERAHEHKAFIAAL